MIAMKEGLFSVVPHHQNFLRDHHKFFWNPQNLGSFSFAGRNPLAILANVQKVAGQRKNESNSRAASRARSERGIDTEAEVQKPNKR